MASQDPRMSQARRSSTQNKSSSSSFSYQDPPSRSSSHGSSEPILLSINNQRVSDRSSSNTNTIKSEPVNIDGNSELLFSNLVTNQQTFYDQEYSMEVIAACISLGADVPTSMQQALVDQHGHFKFGGFPSSAAETDWQWSIGSQIFVAESATADWSWENSSLDYGCTWGREDLHGYFTGIGAQFETQKRL